jgi:hypothetical protein
VILDTAALSLAGSLVVWIGVVRALLPSRQLTGAEVVTSPVLATAVSIVTPGARRHRTHVEVGRTKRNATRSRRSDGREERSCGHCGPCSPAEVPTMKAIVHH